MDDGKIIDFTLKDERRKTSMTKNSKNNVPLANNFSTATEYNAAMNEFYQNASSSGLDFSVKHGRVTNDCILDGSENYDLDFGEAGSLANLLGEVLIH
jgi:hypothetical protein